MTEHKYKWQSVATNGAPPGTYLDEQVFPGWHYVGEWYPFASSARLVMWRRPLEKDAPPKKQRAPKAKAKPDPAPPADE